MKRLLLTQGFLATVDAVGRFECEIEAARARDKKALELFGLIAHLNFP